MSNEDLLSETGRPRVWWMTEKRRQAAAVQRRPRKVRAAGTKAGVEEGTSPIAFDLSHSFGRTQNLGDGSGEFVPFAGFESELAAAFGGEAVELGATIVFGGAFFGGDPATFNEAVESGIERALFDLQHVVGVEFDGFGDGVAVGGAKEQGAEDEQVEGTLEQFDAFLLFFSRHTR